MNHGADVPVVTNPSRAQGGHL